MKKGIHPEYRQVIFYDTNAEVYFKIGSTVQTNETLLWEADGQTYPLVRLDISSASHPYYTGKQRSVNSEGRVSQFQRRFKKTSLNR